MKCTSHICPPTMLCGVIDEWWSGEDCCTCSAVPYGSAIRGEQGEAGWRCKGRQLFMLHLKKRTGAMCMISVQYCSHQPADYILDKHLFWCSCTTTSGKSPPPTRSDKTKLLILMQSVFQNTPASPALEKSNTAVDFTKQLVSSAAVPLMYWLQKTTFTVMTWPETPKISLEIHSWKFWLLAHVNWYHCFSQMSHFHL